MGVWFTSIAQGRERDLYKIGYQMDSCPMAETAARHCVNLPTHRRIRPERLAALLRRAKAMGLRKLQARPEVFSA
jgi:hypothetical protein